MDEPLHSKQHLQGLKVNGDTALVIVKAAGSRTNPTLGAVLCDHKTGSSDHEASAKSDRHFYRIYFIDLWKNLNVHELLWRCYQLQLDFKIHSLSHPLLSCSRVSLLDVFSSSPQKRCLTIIKQNMNTNVILDI